MSFFDDDEPTEAVSEPPFTQEEYDAIEAAIDEAVRNLAEAPEKGSEGPHHQQVLDALLAQRKAYDEAHDAWVKASYGTEKKEALKGKMAALDAATASGAITHSTKTKEEIHDEVAAALGIKEGFNPKTKEEWDWVVNKLVGMKAEQERIERIAKSRIAGIESDIQYLRQKYWAALEAFAAANPEPGKKYCQFDSGRLQSTTSSGGWVIKDKALLLGELAKLDAATQMALKLTKSTVYVYEDLDLVKAHCQKHGDTLNNSMEFKKGGTTWTLQDK